VESQVKTTDHAARSLARRHLQFAWWSLLCFLTLGILLESLHGFKASWYLKPAFATRRLMWTLGHAHGTLLAMVHAVFSFSLMMASARLTRLHRWASPCLMAASILLPGGFLLGGIFTYAGDPGTGVLLVPLGAMLLFVGVLLAALAITRSGVDEETSGEHRDPRQRASRSRS
jgi:hypothetical protein